MITDGLLVTRWLFVEHWRNWPITATESIITFNVIQDKRQFQIQFFYVLMDTFLLLKGLCLFSHLGVGQGQF